MLSRHPLLLLAIAVTLLLPGRGWAQQTYNLTLPWGIWQSQYNETTQVYLFKNVRFGKAPTGELRFKSSVFPTDRNRDIQNSSDVSCYQLAVNRKDCSPGGNAPIQAPNSSLAQSEDCLFLDIYVPKQAMEGVSAGIAKAAVAVWIYGGAYLFGSKNQMTDDSFHTPFYDGTGIVQASNGGTIFVTGNYRLGAFGWLAGSTMEQEGYPNAGLSDQRLLFEWVYENIHQVGGDHSRISAWGESAGASSILHHLISRNATGQVMQPRFTKAALQSPAFQWNWNITGSQQQTFINFTCLVCEQGGVPPCCKAGKVQPTPLYSVEQLQSMDPVILGKANQALFHETSVCNGLFPVGPSVDGNVIRNLAPIEYASGRFARLESVILSHCGNEARSFMKPFKVRTEAEYQHVLESVFPGHSIEAVRSAISKQYPVARYHNNQTLRLKNTIQDAAFLSNNRIMFDAFQGANITTYMLTWDLLNIGPKPGTWLDFSVHASDLPGLFYNDGWNITGFLHYHKIEVPGEFVDEVVSILKSSIAIPYQTYWTRHAQFGNLSVQDCGSKGKLKCWEPASIRHRQVFMQMKVQFGLPHWLQTPSDKSVDKQLPWSMGDFWLKQAQAITAAQSQVSGGAKEESEERDDL